MVGRNKEENETIRGLAGKEDIILKSVSVPGPTAILSGELSKNSLDIATAITAAYSDTAGLDVSDISIEQGERDIRVSCVPVRHKREYKGYMI